jgi:predicted kinase
MSDEAADELITQVRAGRDVLVEYGAAQPEERDRCKRLVEDHGAQWCLINFTAEHGPLAQRPEAAELVTDHG